MPGRKVDSKHLDTASRSASRVVGTDEFKQTLLKHASRATKTGSKPFSLIGLHLKNRPTLEQVAGKEPVDKLMRALRTLISTKVSADNLVCVLSPERVLVLEIGEESDATDLAQQLRLSLEGMKLSGHHVRPAFDIKVVAINGPDLVDDLATLGCEITAHGDLTEKTQPRTRYSGRKESWMSRYQVDESSTGLAVDSWSSRSCVLVSRNISADESQTAALIKQARELQMLDHPSVEPLIDFWISDADIVCVEGLPHGKPLKQWLQTHHVNASAFADLTGQLISVLLYMQSLTPPIVLPDVTAYLYVVAGEGRLLLANFHHDVLTESNKSCADFHSDILQFCRMAAESLSEPMPDELEKLLKRLEPDSASAKAELGTLHKVRGALKEVADKLGTAHVSPREQAANA